MGQLKSPVYLEVSKASQTAIRAIESAGGSVVCKYLNDLALKDVVHGRADRKPAMPVRKADICKILRTISILRLTHLALSVVHELEEPRLPGDAPSFHPTPVFPGDRILILIHA